MKKPILIVNTESHLTDEQTQKLKNTLEQYESFKEFDVVIVSGMQATIYYPPKDEKE